MLYNKTLSKEPGLWCLWVCINIYKRPILALNTTTHKFCLQQPTYEWFDLGKKMTLPDCMNYN